MNSVARNQTRNPFRAGEPLAAAVFHELRLRTIFECFKWDPQVEDTSVLVPFPIFLCRSTWRELSELAERLAAETVAAELEIHQRTELLKNLALPRAIWKLLAAEPPGSASNRARVMRFDFHFTTEGWRISEVNSDVPGGFIEADGFTRLMSEACGAEPAGLPAVAVAESLIRCCRVVAGGGLAGDVVPDKARVALVHASAYSDDRQVMMYLGRELEKGGAEPVLVDPSQVRWIEDRAFVRSEWCDGEVQALYRFFPAEWLPNLGRSAPWQNYFARRATTQCNPGASLISQSKRFGIVLHELRAPMPTWKALLPETRDVRGVNAHSKEWVVKPALGRVGEAIHMAGVTPEKESRAIRRFLRFFGKEWVAQRRFEMIPLATPAGPQYLCLGVYTVDGKAAGVYGRCGSRPIINHTARDVAILLED